MNVEPPFISNIENLQENVRQRPQNKTETAIEFEHIFARHLVQEMTKGLFDAPEGQAFTGHSASFYREHITGTLAKELAEQKRLGMADLILKHWGQDPGRTTKPKDVEEL